MNAARFSELARAAGIGRAFKDGTGERSLRAAELHLVDGLSVEKARKRAGKISKQAVYEVVRKVMARAEACPTCKQPLPHDQPTTRARARRSGKA